MVVLALAIPFAGVAVAGHDTNHDLNCEPEQDQNEVNTNHTITCTITGMDTETNEIDIEFISGPNDPDNGDSPTTPDATIFCVDDETTGANDATCTATYTYTGDGGTGTDVIRFWIDDDQDNTTVDADLGEGRDETTVGGNQTDPDDTDVVEKTWFTGLPAGAYLDCNPETPVNRIGEDETYTCTLTDQGTTPNDTSDDQPIVGAVIDAEQEGVNDPDNAFAPPPDYTCTTNAAGQCTFTVSGAEQQAGTATICAWVDEDTDNGVDKLGAPQDGGDCDTETRDEDAIGATDNDTTDVVTKEWAAAGTGATLDAEPEVDSNAAGTTHTVTATVTDQFGDPVAGVPVDFVVTGDNAGQGCQDVVTNQNGVATCTYTDTDATTDGQDTIYVCADNAQQTETCALATDEGRAEEEDNDLQDAVAKFWFVGGVPAPATVIVDMLHGTDSNTNLDGCDDPADSTASNPVGTTHDLCGEVRDANGDPIPGQPVTLTTDHGTFVDEGGTSNDTTDDQDLGDTITVVTNEQGHYFATIYSEQTGTSTITATSGNASDTGTKTWTALDARNIDCEPETAQNPPGTQHVVTCTVTDLYGNTVAAGIAVDFTETGVGRIVQEDNTTDANGQVEAVVETTETETGTQNITGSLSTGTANTNDQECEQAAGQTTEPNQDATGATAGNCADTVEKLWAPDTGPQPQCSDDIDNDGDGLIDFPDDPGCDSATDDDESDFPHQEFGGDTGQPVTEGACTGFLTGSVQADPDGEGAVIVGTNGPDALQGTDAGDLICALDGDDAVQGHGGNDTIYGGGGKDAIEAGLGDDTVFGEGDKDVILGDDGNDELDGGQGNDNMSGGGGADVLLGRGGWDTLKGNAGDDLLVGAKGRDILQGGGGNDTVRGGADDDVLKGYLGNDVLRGGGGDDIIRASAGRDRLFGNAGNDILNGGPGRDRCRGGRGNDILRNCP